jgi:hypothetical protein
MATSEELSGRRVGPGAPGVVLPDGPRHPRIVQAWLWLKKPTWFLDHCSGAYGDVFTMRLPLGMNLVHVASPELVKAVFRGDSDVLMAGQANAAILEPILGPHSVLVLVIPEVLRAVTLRPASGRPARIRREAVTFVPTMARVAWRPPGRSRR